jgi:hypothetical protein
VTYIEKALRSFVINRAGGCCEYCLISLQDRLFDLAIDHVIAEKHRGPTQAENLSLSCYWCNSYKGSDISSVDWAGTGQIVALYNPRTQAWNDHFFLRKANIDGKTPEGLVTVDLLRLNETKRVEERGLLIQAERYPCQVPQGD